MNLDYLKRALLCRNESHTLVPSSRGVTFDWSRCTRCGQYVKTALGSVQLHRQVKP